MNYSGMRYHYLIVLFVFVMGLKAQTTDASGKKQGYWKKKDEKTNHLIYEGEFKDDKPVGKFKYYYPHDTVRAIMIFKNQGTVAYAKLFHPNGKRMAEGKYINKEVKDSVWLYYDELGVLISKEKYKSGKKNGTSYVYLPDGAVSEERNYKDDIQDGEFKLYFDGKLIKGQGKYVNGLLEGKVVYKFPNGVEAAAGYYVKGNKNGPWIYKNSDGSIKEKELFKFGKLASEKETKEFFAKTKLGDEKKSEKTKESNSTQSSQSDNKTQPKTTVKKGTGK